MGKVSKSLKIRIMNQKEVLEFDGFRVERESFLGGDCYGVVTSCKKDEKGVSYHLEVEFDISTAKFHFPSVMLMRWFLARNFLPAVSSRSWLI